MARSRSWSDRWEHIRHEITLRELGQDVVGKFLLGLGVGALLARFLQPYAWFLIVVGVALSTLVKAKYWKRFWA